MDYVIIVAGGKGLRMGSDIPKQFLPVGGRPVLMRTIERFREFSADLQIILVLPKAQQDYWRELCQQYQFPLPEQGKATGRRALPGNGASSGSYLLADGGETRFHSVLHGLALIPDETQGVVGVHDGVRPFPSTDVISRCYETARQTGAAIPVVPVVETLRHIVSSEPQGFRSSHSGAKVLKSCSPLQNPECHADSCGNGSITVPRADYRLVQTPQTFDIQLLKTAYQQALSQTAGEPSPGSAAGASAAAFTDDASVVEAFGHPITLVEGNRENIKLTTPYDLKIAEVLI